MPCTRKDPRPTSGALCLIPGLTISPWYLALVCERRPTCGHWILVDPVYDRLGNSMDVSGLLKVMPGLGHCSLLQLAAQVLSCRPIMSSSTFPGGPTCLTLLSYIALGPQQTWGIAPWRSCNPFGPQIHPHTATGATGGKKKTQI